MIIDGIVLLVLRSKSNIQFLVIPLHYSAVRLESPMVYLQSLQTLLLFRKKNHMICLPINSLRVGEKEVGSIG